MEEHGGKIVQTGGDFSLIVFDSIDGAVRCGIKVQQELLVHDVDQPADRADPLPHRDQPWRRNSRWH